MTATTLQEKILPLGNGVGWPYLEEDLCRIGIYPALTGSHNTVSFFLKDKPTPEGGLKPERATLQFQLTLRLPGDADQAGAVRTNTSLHLLWQEGEQLTLLAEKSFAGSETRLQIVLEEKAAEALWLASRKKKSGLSLRIQSEIYLPSNHHQYTIRSRMDLEELFRISENHRIDHYYFDAVANNYRLLPTAIKGSEGSRSLQQQPVGKMEKGKIVNAAYAHVAAAELPLVSAKLQHQLNFDSRIQLDRLENWSIPVGGGEVQRDYPLITDASSKFWLNRRNSEEVLVLQEPRLVVPDLQLPAGQSTFRFVFRNTGLTDQQGKPVLEGSMEITLEDGLTESLRAEVEAAHPGKSIGRVKLDKVSYLLEIPYVNEQQETVQMRISPGSVTTTNGHHRLLFRLLNPAIRLCYAAISAPQPKLQLQVMLAFSGYSKLEPQILQLNNIVGAKISKTGASRGPVAALAHKLQPQVLAQLITPAVQYKLQTYVRSVTIPVSFPCTGYGQYYLEEEEGVETAIGCKTAYQLGEEPPACYHPLPELQSEQYKLYRSTQVPNEFLVVPTRYVIGRQELESEGKQIYQPTILLYSTLDAVGGGSKWVLDATLQPGLSLDTRYALEKACSRLTPYPPLIRYLTELPAGSTETVLNLDRMTGTTTRIYPYGHSIRMTVETDISSILIMLDMIRRDAINGLFSISLPGEETYTTRMQPGLQSIGGHWQKGHCSIDYQETGKLLLVNHTENRLQVTGITALVEDAGGTAGVTEQLIELVVELEAFGQNETTVSPGKYQRFIPQYQLLESADIELEQVNNYIEDVQIQVLFVCTADPVQQAWAQVDIEYRLKGRQEKERLGLVPVHRSQEVNLQMPVTHFLLDRVIEYRVSRVIKPDRTETEPEAGFREQDLSEQGNIIYIHL